MSNPSNISRIDTLQSTELAEGVEVHARIAGVFPRAMAHLLDLVFLTLGLCAFAWIWNIFVGLLEPSESTAWVLRGLLQLFFFILSWFYFFFFERAVKAATPGKRLLGLKVVSTDGTKLSAKQAFIRNLLRVADLMPGLFIHQISFFFGTYGLGMISCLFTKKFQRVGDLVADTIVVYSDPPRYIVAPLPEVPHGKIPKVFLSREEEVAIRNFTERAGIWSQARRIEMADHAADLTGVTGERGLIELQAYSKSIAERK